MPIYLATNFVLGYNFLEKSQLTGIIIKAILDTLRCDCWRSYGIVTKNQYFTHCKAIYRDPKTAKRLFPWVQRIIDNAWNISILHTITFRS